MNHSRKPKRDCVDQVEMLINRPDRVPKKLLNAGNITGKVPVYIPEINATIYVAPGTDPEFIRHKYLNNRNKFNH